MTGVQTCALPIYTGDAGWWAEGQIDDDSFAMGIQFLIKEGIISV